MGDVLRLIEAYEDSARDAEAKLAAYHESALAATEAADRLRAALDAKPYSVVRKGGETLLIRRDGGPGSPYVVEPIQIEEA